MILCMHDMVPAASGQMDRNLRVSASDSNLDKDLQGPLSLSPSIEPARLPCRPEPALPPGAEMGGAVGPRGRIRRGHHRRPFPRAGEGEGAGRGGRRWQQQQQAVLAFTGTLTNTFEQPLKWSLAPVLPASLLNILG